MPQRAAFCAFAGRSASDAGRRDLYSFGVSRRQRGTAIVAIVQKMLQ
jgi:hypothetical protein